MLLSAGEGDAALADKGIEATGKFEDLSADMCDSGGIFYLLVASIRAAEADVRVVQLVRI